MCIAFRTYSGVSALAGSLAFLASCSLLFSDSESPAVSDCENPELEGTLAYFAMDESSPSTNLVERESGAAILRSLQFEEVGENATTLSIKHTATIGGLCGNALRSDREEKVFLQLGHDALGSGFDESIRSVDLWFWLNPPEQRDRLSLISKDSSDANDGDFRIELIPDEENENYHLSVRVQSNTESTELCSNVLSTREWHHVAFSLDEEPTLYIDGLVVSDDVTQKTISREADLKGASCGARKVINPRLSNSEDWVIGASNASGPRNPFLRFFNGDIDEIRFLDRPFDASDAEQIRQFFN